MGATHHVSPPRKPGNTPAVHTDISLEDIAVEAGLKFKHESGDPVNKKFLLESTGSGVAIFDYDGDGLEDIFLVNGTRWASLETQSKPTSRLYRNLGDVTEKAGLAHTGWGQGVCVGDYDNDGHEDMLVTYYGHNVLYHNDGNGHFTDVTALAGLPTQGTRWGTGCSFFDYDRDGKLDIAVANYVDFDPKTSPLPGSNQICQFKGLPVMCGPRGLAGGKNILYHNMGDGTFKDVSKASHFDQPWGHYGFHAAFIHEQCRHIVIECCRHNSESAGVVVVSRVGSHVGLLFPLLTKSRSAWNSHVCKCSVVIVAE